MRRFFGSTIGAVDNPFIADWNTNNTSTGSSLSDQIKLPLASTGTYNMTVDWGDGNTDIITAWDQAETTHTYAVGGAYTITIKGQCDGWAFTNTGDRLKILDIKQWGPIKYLTNSSINTLAAYRGCANLDFTATDAPDFSLATGITAFFMGCTNLIGNSSINEWNVSSLSTLDWFFYLASSFNQPLNNWNMSNKTSITNMLRNTAFNHPLNLWNVANVTAFNALFWASQFNQDISGWTIGNATCVDMFRLSPFNQNLAAWDVSGVTSFSNFLLSNTAFSTANYDALLIGWSAQTVQPSVPFHAGATKYSAGAATTARAVLTDAPNLWDITDGGQVI